MDRKIKTRQVHKDIKVLDKTVTVTDHVKHSYVRTKETVMQSTEKSSDRENNPVGYAEDAASEYADRIFHETGHQVRRQAGKIIERKKEKASVSLAGCKEYRKGYHQDIWKISQDCRTDGKDQH